MNAINPSFNNPPATMLAPNAVNPQVFENLKNANVSQVNPPVMDDNFARQNINDKPNKDVKKKKPFNPWKWMVLTPLIAAVATPVIAVGAAGAWFMHTPSSLGKDLTPEKLTKMLEAFGRKEKVNIPEGLKIPTYTGKDLQDLSFIQQSTMGLIKGFRHLPKDNKWEILKYVFSPKGIKDFTQIPLAIYDATTLNFEKLKTRDLSFIATVLAKGGTVTTKYGQSLADIVKQDVLNSHAKVMKLKEAKAPKKDIDKAIASFESNRRFYKSISQLQSQEVQLTKKQEKHFTHLYKAKVAEYNKDNPDKPLSVKPLSALKKIQASTALGVIQDDVFFKLPRTDARADNAVNNFELMVHFSAIQEAGKAILTKQDASLASKDDIVKSALEKVAPIIEGSNFKNEVKGLEAMRALQAEAGVLEGLAPKPLHFSTIKGIDGLDYGVVVMERIKGAGDLSKVTLNAVMSDKPFDLSSKEWKPFRHFMQEDACATVGMQSLRIINGDGHDANRLLKEHPVSKGKNGGAVPIDAAEYLEIPKESMKPIANLFLACVKTGHLQDEVAKTASRNEAMKLLNQLLEKNGKGISDQVKKDLLIEIEGSPLRILGKLYGSPEIADKLLIPNAKGLNANNVKRAETKFEPFIETLKQYETNLDVTTAEGKAFRKSKEKAAEDLLANMETYAGKKVNTAERQAYVDYVRRRFLSTNNSGGEVNLEELKKREDYFKKVLEIIQQQIANY